MTTIQLPLKNEQTKFFQVPFSGKTHGYRSLEHKVDQVHFEILSCPVEKVSWVQF